MTSWKESPGISMPLIGAAAGAIYGASKEGEKHPFFFAALGAGAGVFFGVLMGSMAPEAKVYRVGATSAEIFKAQLRLGRFGYSIVATGVLDEPTRAALKKFQTTYSLLVQDGSLTPETIAYLESLAKQPPLPWSPEAGTYQEAITRQT